MPAEPMDDVVVLEYDDASMPSGDYNDNGLVGNAVQGTMNTAGQAVNTAGQVVNDIL